MARPSVAVTALIAALLLPQAGRCEDVDRPAQKDGGPVGFMDRTGKVVIKPQFDDARPFTEGLAAVKKEGKWGYIDHSGGFAIPPRFIEAKPFRDGLAAVAVVGKGNRKRWGFVDRTGALAIEPRFTFASSFQEGLAYIGWAEPGTDEDRPEPGQSGRRSGYVNIDGTVVITLPRQHAGGSFSEGRAPFVIRFEEGGSRYQAGFIDCSGRIVVPATYQSVSAYSEGLAAVENDENLYGFINPAGNLVIPHRYSFTRCFSNGLASVLLEGRWTYIDSQGGVAFAAKEKRDREGSEFQEGVALAHMDGRDVLIDVRAVPVTRFDPRCDVWPPLQFLDWDENPRRIAAAIFSEGLIRFEDRTAKANGRTRMGFVDRNGAVVIDAMYPEVGEFSEGLAPFSIKAGVFPTIPEPAGVRGE
ncbi:MAG: WG repeat-containing protein [Planctomycetales bacterium]